MLKNTRINKDYVQILQSDGTFRVDVPKGTENAVVRDWETNDGSGTKYELVFTEMSGLITKVEIVKGKFSPNLLQLTISDGEEKPLTLSVPSDNNFGSDLMKKLPNIDFDEYVRLVPYSFKDSESDKIRRGVTVYQGEEENEEGELVGIKIANYFYDADKKKNLKGFPDPVVKKGKETNWKMYFLQVDEFLRDYITENIDIDTTPESTEDEDAEEEDEEEDAEAEDWRPDEERKKNPKAPPVKKTVEKKEDKEVKPAGYKGKVAKKPKF